MSAVVIFAIASVVISVAQIEISTQAAERAETDRYRYDVAGRACSALIILCGLGVLWSAP